MGESELIFPPGLHQHADREQWWRGLPSPWRNAFRETCFQNIQAEEITDQELQLLCSTHVLRIMGPSGSYSNFSGSLYDLEGISALTNLQYLFVMHCQLRSLAGIERLYRLKSLFINNNQLTSLDALQNHPQLEELYVGNNLISTLAPLASCTRLHTLYCENNHLTSLEGITAAHEERLKQFICRPNPGISHRQILQVQNEYGILCH